MSGTEAAEAQRERAGQAWCLVILSDAEPAVLAASRKILRVKRLELADFAARLPGVVRRGARVDLMPLEEALREAGVRCEVRRSERRDEVS